ncbi:MAG: VWA domain-containing protein [Pirellulaceae bacterium]
MNKHSRNRRGATMVAVVILMPVLFILSALAINLAYIQVVDTKTQIVTDAAARAAGRVYAETGDEAASLSAAQEMAQLNPINTFVVPLDASDLEFGLATRTTKNKVYTFTPGANGNAVRVQTQSYANGSGPALEPFFPTFGNSFQIRPLCKATNSQTTLDVAVIVDRSGSMAYAADEMVSNSPPAAAPAGWVQGDHVPPNSRWLDLESAVDGFCDELNNTSKAEKVALISYSSSASRDIELTDDYSQISDRNSQIAANQVAGATNIGDGILLALDAVTEPQYARPWATNALVLMSDGNHNTGTDPIVAAGDAVNQGIPIYTISFSTEADQQLMQDIADMTGGTHYHADDAQQLNDAFRKIARRLPSILTE